MTLKLDWCSYTAAKYACEHWHYSHSLPQGKTVKVGVWEDGRFIGAVIFGYGANNNIGNPYGLTMQQTVELMRVALTTHQAPVTRVVAIAIRLLRKQSPGLRLVVSYADSGQGHLGGIYQAGNWVYVGLVRGKRQFLVKGKWVHARMVGHIYGTEQGIDVPKKPGSKKYKYLLALDEAMQEQIDTLRRPYPKRVGSIASDVAAVQVA